MVVETNSAPLTLEQRVRRAEARLEGLLATLEVFARNQEHSMAMLAVLAEIVKQPPPVVEVNVPEPVVNVTVEQPSATRTVTFEREYGGALKRAVIEDEDEEE